MRKAHQHIPLQVTYDHVHKNNKTMSIETRSEFNEMMINHFSL